MTVPVQATFTASIANGATTVFPYGFKIAAAEDLAVTVDGVRLTSGYTVSGVGNPAGGNVTITAAPANGAKVVRYLAPIMKRDTDYQQFGDWLAAVVNLDFDRIWLTLQTLQQNDIRSLKLPLDTIVDQVLTQDAAARANRTIKFDGAGNLTISTYDPDAAQTEAAASATASAASATAASGSATSAAGSATAASGSATAAAGSATSSANSAAAAAAAVGNVLVSANDTTGGKLSSKLAAGSGVTLTVQNPGANENIRIDASGASEQSLTQYCLPSADGAYRDLYRSGWLPAWFNQQWGGAQWGGLPDGSVGAVATGQVQDDTWFAVGSGASTYYRATGFKVSESATFDAVWVKLYKVGNPTGNLTARIYSDTAGSPSAAIGSAVTLPCKSLNTKADGEWYQITGLAAALTAGTQYHLVLTMSGTDVSNYAVWKGTASSKYPLGYRNDGTSTPTWTPATGNACCFLIQNPAANSILQSSGMFDYKLTFAAGSPVNQSRAVAQPLVNFYDGKSCTVLYRGTYAINTTVFDFSYGIDHDRITLTINGSGYPVLTIYESNGQVNTVTGTSSVTSGNHDVGVKLRTVGDGADLATLYIDGASNGTPLTAQTFTMSNEFRQLGTARLGDGFGLAPTWTGNAMTDTAQLPSHANNGTWTYTGTTSEAGAYSMQGGKLYRNTGGISAVAADYYSKTMAFNNATGWTVKWKGRVPSSPNTTTSGTTLMQVNDGTKTVNVYVQEYFVQSYGSGALDFTVQGDFKSQEHVFELCGKGSDYYLMIDGKLAIDGTGKLTAATATNSIVFGDVNNNSGENADAIWSYLKYYTGGLVLPTAGANTCSEFAYWSGDRSSLLPTLWNSGTPKSVKEVCGVPRNYQFEQVVQRELRRGVISAPTTTSTSDTLLPDMECYVIGSDLVSDATLTAYNSTAGQNVYLDTYVDGAFQYESFNYAQSSLAGAGISIPSRAAGKVPLGLHKVENRWQVNANTGTAAQTKRSIKVEARS